MTAFADDIDTIKCYTVCLTLRNTIILENTALTKEKKDFL